MSAAGGPWSVKGIDPKAREMAKDFARRSGLTLGEWINQLILEGDEEEEPQPIRPPERPRPSRSFSGPAYAAATTTPRLSSFSSRGGGYRASAALRREEEPVAEPDDLSRVTAALERLSERIETAEHRSTLAITGIDQSVAGALARLEASEREQGMTASRLDEALQELHETQGAVIDRLRRVETDDAPRRSADALKALEQALGRIASQLYEGETRTQAAIGELRQELGGVAARVKAAEAAVPAAQPAGPEPEAVIEGVLARIAERIEQAEGRTGDAMRAMEGSFAALDARLREAEIRLAEPPVAAAPDTRADDQRFERLATDLSARVDSARLEMAERLGADTDARLDQIDGAVRDMARHVEAAEQRSADAIERMGREVMRIADLLGRRVSEVDARTLEAAERVSASVETRLTRNDGAQAEAIERLGVEIARISERLAERIGASERRSAQAIDEVGEQVVRVTDKINQRYDRAAADLADSIRQSEERTARLLEDARERIDGRLGEVQSRATTQMSPIQQSLAALSSRIDQMEAGSPFGGAGPSAFDPPTFTPSAYAGPSAFSAPPRYEEPTSVVAEPLDSRPEGGRPSFDPFADLEAGALDAPAEAIKAAEPGPALAVEEEPAVAPLDVEPDEVIEPVFGAFPSDEAAGDAEPSAFDIFGEEAAAPPTAALDDEGPFSGAALPPPMPMPATDDAPRSRSTREMLDAAREAARTASAPAAKPVRGAPTLGPRPLGPSSLQRPAVGKAPGVKAAASPLRSALFVSAALAVVAVGSWGYYLAVTSRAEPETDATVAPVVASRPAAAAPAPASPPDVPTPAGPAAAAAALAGPQITPAIAAPAPPAAAPPAGAAATTPPAPSGASQYASAVALLSAGQREPGLQGLRAAAEGGHAPAQFYLARVYEQGQHGVAANPAEARRWTDRAARGGEARAMHNLALFHYEGTGGPRNLSEAVGWFRRASEAGLVDSQYNLGRMYEQGLGVPQNAAEAFKWYVIAGAGGDGEARASIQRLRGSLSAEARAAAERSAQAFRAQRGLAAPAVATATPPAPAAASAGDPAVAAAQRGLSRLGYYQGPADGTSTPGLRAAVVAFQRAQNLPVTGQVDDALIARMASASR